MDLREMTTAEYDAWYAATTQELADSQVTIGNWPADGALERAHESRRKLLPQGRDTEGMLFRTAVTSDGTPVGAVWIGLTHPNRVPDCAFLFYIEVAAEHRGRGLGRALLTACEDEVAARGIGALELNVFGHNTRAVHLYETADYSVVTQQMRKPLPRK